MSNYNHKKIEDKWKDDWYKDNIYEAIDFSPKPKKYILAELPYPSGKFLHIGHMMRYTVPEIYSRFLRMQGYNVLFPMGWDSFGLPAETFAIKEGITPQEAIAKATVDYKKAMQNMGYAIDWSREINTSDPEYYKWTQLMFIKLWEKGLAKVKEMPVWWCKELGVLADEEVLPDEKSPTGKKSERGGYPVERKQFKQWVLDIPAYADRLLEDLDKVAYTDSVKEGQRNWIGRKEGARVIFTIGKEKVEVFTTRPDTIYGVSYIAIAPEHNLVQKLIENASNKQEVQDYINKSKNLTDLEKQTKEKTGVQIKGVYARHPLAEVTTEIPVYVADYILLDYGTGVVMGVPGHDERDFEFALKYNLPLIQVVNQSPDKLIGLVTRKWSKDFDKFVTALDKLNPEYIEKTIDRVLYVIDESQIDNWVNIAKDSVLEGAWHDIVGNKFVMVTSDGNIYTENKFEDSNGVFEVQKQMEPSVREFKSLWEMLFNSSYKSFVANANPGIMQNSGKYNGLSSEEFKEIVAKRLQDENLGKKAYTYKIREQVFSRQRYWGEPIPLIYTQDGKVEKVPEEQLPLKLPVMKDFLAGEDGISPLAKNNEWNTTVDSQGNPAKRETDTMPTWAGSNWYYVRYIDPKNDTAFADMEKMRYWMPVDQYFGDAGHTTAHLIYSRFWYKFLYNQGLVPTPEPYHWRMSGGMLLGPDHQKMSKSKGNVLNPADIMESYGADATRIYLAFLGPYEDTFPWNENGIKACYRLMNTIYEMRTKVVNKDPGENQQLQKAFHKALKSMTLMMAEFKMNTSVSEIMKLVNEFKKQKEIPASIWTEFVKVIAPFAPFLAEDLWQELNGFTTWKKSNSVHLQEWPKYDEVLTMDETIPLPIQINGKLRDTIEIARDLAQEQVKEIVMTNKKIKVYIDGKEIKNFVYIPNKIVNIVL